MPDYNDNRNRPKSQGGLLEMIRNQLNNMAAIGDMKMRSFALGGNDDENNGESPYEEENSDSLKENNFSPEGGSKKNTRNAGKSDKTKTDESKTIRDAEQVISKDIKNNDNLLNLRFSSESVLQGIIYSEVLGKPKCKRRRRW